MSNPEDTLKGKITTRKGRVVYDRKKHVFEMNDILRILTRWVANTPSNQWRSQSNAGRIRALYFISINMYAQVQDLFEPFYSTYRKEIIELVDLFLEEFIEIVAIWFENKVRTLGIDIPAREAIVFIGRAINDFFRNLFIGE